MEHPLATLHRRQGRGGGEKRLAALTARSATATEKKQQNQVQSTFVQFYLVLKVATIGLQHSSSLGWQAQQLETMKSVLMAAHLCSTASLRDSTMGWRMEQAFHSISPHTAKSSGERSGEDGGHIPHGQKSTKCCLHQCWTNLLLCAGSESCCHTYLPLGYMASNQDFTTVCRTLT